MTIFAILAMYIMGVIQGGIMFGRGPFWNGFRDGFNPLAWRKILHKHEWKSVSLGKRKCVCGAEQRLVTVLYPKIGEPEHEWRDVPTLKKL